MSSDTYYFALGTQILTGKIYGDTTPSGGVTKYKQDGATSLRTGARKDVPDGTNIKFNVVFDDPDEADAFIAYISDKEEDADIQLYARTPDWCYDVYAVQCKPPKVSGDPNGWRFYDYEVTCYLYSPFSHPKRPSRWSKVATSLPETTTISNRKGFFAASFESLQLTCHYNAAKVQALSLDIGGDSLTICDVALSEEVWELLGNENRLLETYEDPVASITQFNQDVTKSGTITYSSGALLFENAAYAIYRLSGPHQATYPVKMTADILLDSGGATGEASILVSPDNVSYVEVLNQDDFESGETEYVLSGTEYMTDIYVKILNNSGTGGKYLRINSIKFEVERWIDDGEVPMVAKASSAVATVDSTGSEHVDIEGEFYQYRLFL